MIYESALACSQMSFLLAYLFVIIPTSVEVRLEKEVTWKTIQLGRSYEELRGFVFRWVGSIVALLRYALLYYKKHTLTLAVEMLSR